MLVIGYNAVRDFRVENAYLEHPFFSQLGGCFTYHSPSTRGCIVSPSHHPLSFLAVIGLGVFSLRACRFAQIAEITRSACSAFSIHQLSALGLSVSSHMLILFISDNRQRVRRSSNHAI